MAQYFEVLSQSDGSVDQNAQFFNGSQENESTQVQYILAEDSRPFQTQQLILSADQVMVVDGSQQQIQGVVIDQGQIAYQQTGQPQQYSAVVQTTNVNTQQPQQIYYMETNSGQGGDNLQTVQTVIEQASAIQQGSQVVTQPQPIVLNHQIGTSNRQVVQATTQRNVLQLRPPIRPGHIQVNLQNRSISTPMRQGLPQQVRPHQSSPHQMRPMTPPQPPIRPRAPINQIRQPTQQIQQRPVMNQQQQRPPQDIASMINRQLGALQQQNKTVGQQHRQQLIQQPGGQMIPNQVQKGISEFQRQQQLKNNEHQEILKPIEKTVSIGKQIKKPLSDFRPLSEADENNPTSEPEQAPIGKQITKPLSECRPLSAKDELVEELDDHDPAMNSSPADYKKFMEQKQQIAKNPLFARISSGVKITQTTSNQQPPNQQPPNQLPPNQLPPNQLPPSSVNQTIDDVVNQVTQQQSQMQQQSHTQPQQLTLQPQHPMATGQQPQPNATQSSQMPLKKPKAPPRTKTSNANPRNSGAIRQRMPRLPVNPQPFSPGRIIGPQQPPPGPRFTMNQQQQQQQPRFANQQQMMQQRMTQHQQAPQHPQPQPPQQQPQAQPVQQQHPPPPPQQPPPIQQNGGNQSQMNYLITPPTPNRPRQQRPLPAYIPSSQIQQIIGMFKESTPIAEEFSDSIRMLVLLENGEQRLITFTLPKEACTIQEILEQVNVPFTSETNIQVTEANTNGINYIVTVGNVSNIAYATSEEEQQEAPSPESLSQQQPQQQMAAHPPPNRQMPQQNNRGTPYPQKTMSHDQIAPISHPVLPPEPPKPPTPDPPKELPPKLIPGKLAVCLACGYTGEDFNRCTRCMRKLPDNVRSVDSPMKMDLHKQLPPEVTKNLLNHSPPTAASTPVKPNVTSKAEPVSVGPKQPSPTKKKTKSKPVENESVVISSDEEEDEKKPVKSVSEQLLKNLSASISISPVTKEPSLTEIKKHIRKLSNEPSEIVKISLTCRTVRIGSYRFVPPSDIIIDSKCVIVKAPMTDNKSEIKTIRIDRGDIVKVLACFSKSLPVIFYYLNVGAAPMIRDMLNMKKETGLYYDPVEEKEDSYRKITLLPEDFGEDHKSFFNQLYSIGAYSILDELTAKEANDILIKTCPKDTTAANQGSFSEIKQILLYPKEGQGRLSINTEDYVCLAIDQFLNDKIIDFYLKYLWENLPAEKQKKVHIFSTFFYKRLTTKPTKAAKKSHPFESDSTLTAAEKRHCRVKNWTKRINLFDKDFIIVPINENAHWFLAIICFPGMRGAQTFDGKPYKPEPKVAKAAKKKSGKNIKESKKEKPIPCDDPMLSDKDEAESEDSDMESDDSEESNASAAAAAIAAPVAPVAPPPPPARSRGSAVRVPIKQPCILIFDSLAGPSRCRVVATLRDYLTMEYKSKMDTERVFNRDVIKGTCCKVPQQNNFTDCGLYLLQYVEQFFNFPIKDYNTPIKGIQDWFEEIVVTKKREDICNLIKRLMEESGADTSLLPDIALPTVNGTIIERPEESELDHETGEEEQEDMFTDIEDSEMTDSRTNNTPSSKMSDENGDAKTEESHESRENSSGSESSPPGSLQSSPLKPSVEGGSDGTDIVTSVMQPLVKPSLSEFSIPRQTTNKDTLNYLKSKRIIRHKPVSDGPEYKKTKFDN